MAALRRGGMPALCGNGVAPLHRNDPRADPVHTAGPVRSAGPDRFWGVAVFPGPHLEADRKSVV